MSTESKEDLGSNENKKHRPESSPVSAQQVDEKSTKSVHAPISVQIIDENGHEGVSDTPHSFSHQPTPSTSVQMTNEGK